MKLSEKSQRTFGNKPELERIISFEKMIEDNCRTLEAKKISEYCVNFSEMLLLENGIRVRLFCLPSIKFDHLLTQRITLSYFLEIHFRPTDPKIFLKTPSAPIYTNFEGERAPKKPNFLVEVF